MSQLGSTARHSGQKLDALRDNLRNVIRGKSDVVEHAIITLVAGGSLLIEDVPGVGKTTLAKAIAASLDLKFQRVQCTPDLLPADILGCSVLNPRNGTFSFQPGPVFANVLLVDEINRASPRTQSALLEVMAEGQVTIEGKRRAISQPFFVAATQNPLGFQGTFALPESQLDRFLMQLSMEYPEAKDEVEILFDQIESHPLDGISSVLSKEELLDCQTQARGVNVSRQVAEYVVEIVRRTRDDNRIKIGCSPRGSLMLFRASQAAAFLEQRNFVLPDDVQRMVPLVLPHRFMPAESSRSSAGIKQEITADILKRVEVPV